MQVEHLFNSLYYLKKWLTWLLEVLFMFIENFMESMHWIAYTFLFVFLLIADPPLAETYKNAIEYLLRLNADFKGC